MFIKLKQSNRFDFFSALKLILDIKDNKAAFIMELLGNFNFVKAAPLGKHDAAMLETLMLAVEEVNDIKAGRKASQSLTSFLNTLKN